MFGWESDNDGVVALSRVAVKGRIKIVGVSWRVACDVVAIRGRGHEEDVCERVRESLM